MHSGKGLGKPILARQAVIQCLSDFLVGRPGAHHDHGSLGGFGRRDGTQRWTALKEASPPSIEYVAVRGLQNRANAECQNNRD